jgi:hypothetical protein
MPVPDWLKKLQEMLCRIYEEWGGNCADLPFSVPAQILVLADEYKEQGDPQFGSQTDLLDFLQLLSDTVAHLDLPGNSLEPADDLSLRTLIACLQTDLTPAA